MHSSFAGIIPHQPRPRSDSANARDVDNGAALSQLKHLRNHVDNAPVYAFQIRRDDFVELFLRDFERGLILVGGPGIVDEDVEAVEVGDGGLAEAGPVGKRSHVGDYDVH